MMTLGILLVFSIFVFEYFACILHIGKVKESEAGEPRAPRRRGVLPGERPGRLGPPGLARPRGPAGPPEKKDPDSF